MELYQVHLETVGNEPGGTFSFNPLDIQLWTWIRPLNSWVRRTLTPCHSFKLFIPSSPSNKSTRDCPPLTRHTHTHTHVQLPDMPVLFQRTLDSESRQVTMVLWLLLCPAHQGMEISVHMFLKSLWERSVGLHEGHNGRLCHKERIWAGRQQQSCWTQSLSAKAVGENHVLGYRASSLGKVEHFT